MIDELRPFNKVMQGWMALLLAKRILDNIENIEKCGIFNNWSEIMGKSRVDLRKIEINSIKDMAYNLTIIALGGCFIVTNEALEKKFGNFTKKLLVNDMSNVDLLRAIIFQARNAFAHTLTSPKWDFRDKTYERLYQIKDSSINFDLKIDFNKLNHKQLKIDHLGGWSGFNRLITYAMTVLQ